MFVRYLGREEGKGLEEPNWVLEITERHATAWQGRDERRWWDEMLRTDGVQDLWLDKTREEL
jgi:hypothetical protein